MGARLEKYLNFDYQKCLYVTPPNIINRYRKILKPMLERRRRARVNRCLEQLRELVVSSSSCSPLGLGQAGPSKLEKADVLEMTVSQLKRDGGGGAVQWDRGFVECAEEVSRSVFIRSSSGNGVLLRFSACNQ